MSITLKYCNVNKKQNTTVCISQCKIQMYAATKIICYGFDA